MSRKGLLSVGLVVGLFGVALAGPSCLAEAPEADAGPTRTGVREPARRRDPRPDTSPQPVRVELVDGGDTTLPTYRQDGTTWVLGGLGQRYEIKLTNTTSRRIEAVVSVDGLDVLDGKPAAFERRGYIVPPYGSTRIAGFRRSQDEVAAFRFSSVRDSYAARKGDDRDVGVIGVALFEEELRAPVDIPSPRAEAAAPPVGAGAAPRAGREARDDGAQGMGTKWGEDRTSRVRETPFERASSRPLSVTELRYDDREGLVRRGVLVEPDRPWRRDPRPFPGDDRRYAEPPPR